jgi:hypothetical protein
VIAHAHELVVTEPAYLLVLLVVAVAVSLACHVHRDQARERHHERRANGGFG